MTRLQHGDVVFQDTAQAHYFQGVRAQGFLMMISQGDEKEKAGQKCDNDNADSGPGEKFEMKMLRAKKPRGAPAKNASTYLRVLGHVDLSHYKIHKSR